MSKTKINTLTLAAPTQHLQQLAIIRNLLLGCLWLSLLFSLLIKDTQLLYREIIVILVSFTILHCLTFIRLRNNLRVTELEFFIHLIIDVCFINALLFFSGGASNPFISYLLVPICISAATLPWRYTCFITSLCIATYSSLLFFYIPLPLFNIDHQHNHSNLNWHILGMWFNFFISAVLITYFVVKMAQTLRKNNEILTQLREDELRNEQLIAVATLAASAAHEINTPLSTMTVLLSELRNDHQQDQLLLKDLNLLSQQVNYCSATLKQLVQNASGATQGQLKRQTVSLFCKSINDRWQLLRPSINFFVETLTSDFDPVIAIDPSIDYAIINLLNNAADASPEYVGVKISWSNQLLTWIIVDRGPGIEQHLHRKLGKELNSTKVQGLGLGMLLTHATIKRFGGSVVQTANRPQGTITELNIPLKTAVARLD